MERKARSDERRSERKDRLDEIRRKYGLYIKNIIFYLSFVDYQTYKAIVFHLFLFSFYFLHSFKAQPHFL